MSRIWAYARSAGAARIAALVVLNSGQAAIPVAMVYAFRSVVEAVTGTGQVSTAVARLGVLLIAQRLLELATEPVQLWVARRIDITFRTRLAGELYRPISIAHGETETVRGHLATVGGDLHGHTPGTATVARFSLAAKMIAGGWCLVIIGRDSIWAALIAFVLLVARRALQQRSFHFVYRSWRLTGPPSRRLDYWKRFHIDAAAAKEIRVFDLPDWSLGRYRTAAWEKFAPVWAGRRTATRTSWLPFGLALIGAFVIFVMLADQSGLSAPATAQVIAAGLTALRLSEPAGENLAIEHARPIDAAADEVEKATAQQLAVEGSPPARLRTSVAPPNIRLDGVHFSYPHDRRTVLHGVDLDIPAGSTLAIVGVNGAGKSTLTKLLARLYEPTAGRIAVDGIDLVELDVAGWRRNLAVMMQGFVHYDLSLRDNVELGAAERRGDGAFFEKLRPGLDLDDLAARLPDGWNTRLGTGGAGGVNLSGGEWQRVGLARAMYAVRAGRTVVVLDEPTAHLDADAEARARAQLEAINAAATVIVVSHRLATVWHADQIVVLADGAVRERGTHETLMAAGGQYAHMYVAQSERYLADVPSAAR